MLKKDEANTHVGDMWHEKIKSQSLYKDRHIKKTYPGTESETLTLFMLVLGTEARPLRVLCKAHASATHSTTGLHYKPPHSFKIILLARQVAQAYIIPAPWEAEVGGFQVQV